MISGEFHVYEAERLTATLSYARHHAAPMAELIVSACDLTQRGYYLAQKALMERSHQLTASQRTVLLDAIGNKLSGEFRASLQPPARSRPDRLLTNLGAA